MASDDQWQWCPFEEDGKGGGCIILVRIGEEHDGPHHVVKEEDEDA